MGKLIANIYVIVLQFKWQYLVTYEQPLTKLTLKHFEMQLKRYQLPFTEAPQECNLRELGVELKTPAREKSHIMRAYNSKDPPTSW